MNKVQEKNLVVLSRYRGALFGFSALSIVLFHFCTGVSQLRSKGFLYELATCITNLFGSVGVDIFLFLSGVGLFFSLKKSGKDFSCGKFYEKRAERVLLPYFLWGLPYWILMDLVWQSKGLFRFSLDLSLISFWITEDNSFWFISLIGMVCLVFPFIFKLFDAEPWKSGILCLLLCLCTFLFCEYARGALPVFYDNTKVALYRIPIFLIGTWYGNRIYHQRRIGMIDYLLITAGAAVELLFMLKKQRVVTLPFFLNSHMTTCFFSITLMFLICFVLQKLNSQKLNASLVYIGGFSLEIYMTHVSWIHIFKVFGVIVYALSHYFLIIVLSVVSIAALRCMTQWLQKRIHLRKGTSVS